MSDDGDSSNDNNDESKSSIDDDVPLSTADPTGFLRQFKIFANDRFVKKHARKLLPKHIPDDPELKKALNWSALTLALPSTRTKHEHHHPSKQKSSSSSSPSPLSTSTANTRRSNGHRSSSPNSNSPPPQRLDDSRHPHHHHHHTPRDVHDNDVEKNRRPIDSARVLPAPVAPVSIPPVVTSVADTAFEFQAPEIQRIPDSVDLFNSVSFYPLDDVPIVPHEPHEQPHEPHEPVPANYWTAAIPPVTSNGVDSLQPVVSMQEASPLFATLPYSLSSSSSSTTDGHPLDSSAVSTETSRNFLHAAAPSTAPESTLAVTRAPGPSPALDALSDNGDLDKKVTPETVQTFGKAPESAPTATMPLTSASIAPPPPVSDTKTTPSPTTTLANVSRPINVTLAKRIFDRTKNLLFHPSYIGQGDRQLELELDRGKTDQATAFFKDGTFLTGGPRSFDAPANATFPDLIEMIAFHEDQDHQRVEQAIASRQLTSQVAKAFREQLVISHQQQRQQELGFFCNILRGFYQKYRATLDKRQWWPPKALRKWCLKCKFPIPPLSTITGQSVGPDRFGSAVTGDRRVGSLAVTGNEPEAPTGGLRLTGDSRATPVKPLAVNDDSRATPVKPLAVNDDSRATLVKPLAATANEPEAPTGDIHNKSNSDADSKASASLAVPTAPTAVGQTTASPTLKTGVGNDPDAPTDGIRLPGECEATMVGPLVKSGPPLQQAASPSVVNSIPNVPKQTEVHTTVLTDSDGRHVKEKGLLAGADAPVPLLDVANGQKSIHPTHTVWVQTTGSNLTKDDSDWTPFPGSSMSNDVADFPRSFSPLGLSDHRGFDSTFLANDTMNPVTSQPSPRVLPPAFTLTSLKAPRSTPTRSTPVAPVKHRAANGHGQKPDRYGSAVTGHGQGFDRGGSAVTGGGSKIAPERRPSPSPSRTKSRSPSRLSSASKSESRMPRNQVFDSLRPSSYQRERERQQQRRHSNDPEGSMDKSHPSQTHSKYSKPSRGKEHSKSHSDTVKYRSVSRSSRSMYRDHSRDDRRRRDRSRSLSDGAAQSRHTNSTLFSVDPRHVHVRRQSHSHGSHPSATQATSFPEFRNDDDIQQPGQALSRSVTVDRSLSQHSGSIPLDTDQHRLSASRFVEFPSINTQVHASPLMPFLSQFSGTSVVDVTHALFNSSPLLQPVVTRGPTGIAPLSPEKNGGVTIEPIVEAAPVSRETASMPSNLVNGEMSLVKQELDQLKREFKDQFRQLFEMVQHPAKADDNTSATTDGKTRSEPNSQPNGKLDEDVQYKILLDVVQQMRDKIDSQVGDLKTNPKKFYDRLKCDEIEKELRLQQSLGRKLPDSLGVGLRNEQITEFMNNRKRITIEEDRFKSGAERFINSHIMKVTLASTLMETLSQLVSPKVPGQFSTAIGFSQLPKALETVMRSDANKDRLRDMYATQYQSYESNPSHEMWMEYLMTAVQNLLQSPQQNIMEAGARHGLMVTRPMVAPNTNVTLGPDGRPVEVAGQQAVREIPNDYAQRVLGPNFNAPLTSYAHNPIPQYPTNSTNATSGASATKPTSNATPAARRSRLAAPVPVDQQDKSASSPATNNPLLHGTAQMPQHVAAAHGYGMWPPPPNPYGMPPPHPYYGMPPATYQRPGYYPGYPYPHHPQQSPHPVPYQHPYPAQHQPPFPAQHQPPFPAQHSAQHQTPSPTQHQPTSTAPQQHQQHQQPNAAVATLQPAPTLQTSGSDEPLKQSIPTPRPQTVQIQPPQRPSQSSALPAQRASAPLKNPAKSPGQPNDSKTPAIPVQSRAAIGPPEKKSIMTRPPEVTSRPTQPKQPRVEVEQQSPIIIPLDGTTMTVDDLNLAKSSSV